MDGFRPVYELQMWVFALVRSIPGHLGCWIRRRVMPFKAGTDVTVWEQVHIERPSKLVLGDRVSLNRGCILNAEGGITLGDDVLVGPGVVIYSQNHRFEDPHVPINQQGYVRRSVTIEDDVWIAARAIVLPGVTLHRGCVVAAGAVVTEDVPAGTVVAGVPAVKVKAREAGDLEVQ